MRRIHPLEVNVQRRAAAYADGECTIFMTFTLPDVLVCMLTFKIPVPLASKSLYVYLFHVIDAS